MANFVLIGEIVDRLNEIKAAVISIAGNVILIGVRVDQRAAERLRWQMQNVVDEDTEAEREYVMETYVREVESERVRALEGVPDDLRVGMDAGVDGEE